MRDPGSGSRGPGCASTGTLPTFPGPAAPTCETRLKQVTGQGAFCSCTRGRRGCARARVRVGPVSGPQHSPGRQAARGSASGGKACEASYPRQGQEGEGRALHSGTLAGCWGLRSASSPFFLSLFLLTAVFWAPLHREGGPWPAEPLGANQMFPFSIFCALRTHIWNLVRRESD